MGALGRPEVTGFGASTPSKVTTPQKAGDCGSVSDRQLQKSHFSNRKGQAVDPRVER